MFQHLPKITQGDLEFMCDALIGRLMERATGAEDLDEGWERLCEGLSQEWARALRAGADMVSETHLEDSDLRFVVNWAVGVAELVILVLVDRRLEQQELEKKLGF